MSRKSSPWQNGCQESFFSQFKLELGSALIALRPRATSARPSTARYTTTIILGSTRPYACHQPNFTPNSPKVEVEEKVSEELGTCQYLPELAKEFGLNKSKLHYWWKQGLFKEDQIVGRMALFDYDRIKEIIKKKLSK